MIGGYLFGVLWLVSSTFAIDHFELFGLRQGLGMGELLKFVPEGFVTILHYRLVRHPIMTGFFIMLFSIVEFTAGRVFIAAFISSYILVWYKTYVVFDEFSVRDKISGGAGFDLWNRPNLRKIHENNSIIHPFSQELPFLDKILWQNCVIINIHFNTFGLLFKRRNVNSTTAKF